LHDRYSKILFSDNGIGFSQDNAEKVFELFQRLHGRQEFSGTGIGLTICRKIVQNHDGFITATSEVNKGTTFTIYLPYKWGVASPWSFEKVSLFWKRTLWGFEKVAGVLNQRFLLDCISHR
jgi:signal transduction histidine kinase